MPLTAVEPLPQFAQHILAPTAPCHDLEHYCRDLNGWPRSWMGLEKDLPPDEQLVTLFRPFLECLSASDPSPKTIQTRRCGERRKVRTHILRSDRNRLVQRHLWMFRLQCLFLALSWFRAISSFLFFPAVTDTSKRLAWPKTFYITSVA